jgi:hypothetical protein
MNTIREIVESSLSMRALLDTRKPYLAGIDTIVSDARPTGFSSTLSILALHRSYRA